MASASSQSSAGALASARPVAEHVRSIELTVAPLVSAWPSESLSTKQISAPSQSPSEPSPGNSVAPGYTLESLSSQSVAGSFTPPSPTSSQSRSSDPTVAPLASRNPSRSTSAKQVSWPSQSLSTPSPTESTAPGKIPAFVSSQSSWGSIDAASPLALQVASADATVAPLASAWPSLSASARQISDPSQSWSVSSAMISAALGFTPPSVSSQSVAGELSSVSPGPSQAMSVEVTVVIATGRKPSSSASA